MDATSGRSARDFVVQIVFSINIFIIATAWYLQERQQQTFVIHYLLINCRLYYVGHESMDVIRSVAHTPTQHNLARKTLFSL